MAAELVEVRQPLVGVIMGSDSDLPVMQGATRFLDKIGIVHEFGIKSAHRTPLEMFRYADSASTRGLKVIIAGAGGAAHLPGMVAGMTELPVIGVPMKTGFLDGLDSLLSIVQMPRGVPVATVAVNGGGNAGILAAQIVGTSDPEIANAIRTYKLSIRDGSIKTHDELQRIGIDAYLNQKDAHNAQR